MDEHLSTIANLINALKSFPGIGTRQATRMAYDILKMDDDQVENIVTAIMDTRAKVHTCPRCGLYTDKEICDICEDENRDHSQLLIISYPKDALSFEKNHTFNGIYFVLNGLLSANLGRSVEDLHLDKLIERIHEEGVEEVIIATDPTIEGETTALYIANALGKENVKISRLAYGLPMGASLDYADSLTLERALKGRTKIE